MCHENSTLSKLRLMLKHYYSMPYLLTRFPIHREVLIWYLLVLSFRLSAKITKKNHS